MSRPLFLVVLTILPSIALAEKAAPMSALAKMPAREITVFKDGHALLLHSGKMPTNSAGNVLLDYLPAPVLGTFWAYSTQKDAKLSAVTSSQRKVLVDRTVLSLRDFIEANLGAQTLITESPVVGKDAPPSSYAATILSLPSQSGEELESTSPPYAGDKLPVKGNLVLLKTAEGVKAVNLERILDITIKGEPKTVLPREEFRNLMTLKLDWAGAKTQAEAEVGMMYLQRGVRWIPNYKVTIDGKGSARLQLQATLINELADLDDVTAHLVIGVPSFAFKETVDPMSLQQGIAQLSQYFREDSRTAYALSNTLMSQSARMREVQAPADEAPRGPGLGPEVAGSGKNEDLFIFTVQRLGLRKGQRMTLPIAQYTLTYKDVYTLDVPFSPPPEIRQHFDSSRQAELARLFAAPKVMHKIRLLNKSDYPLTTAPAMILKDERVIAQGMMTYTAIGGSSDLDMTTAVDIRVKKSDVETKRTPNAANWQGNTYGRIDLSGKIHLTHFGKQPIEVEVVRNVLGNVTEADSGGKIEMVNVFEDWSVGGTEPYWWRWWSWPYWWHHFNGVGRVTWTVKLEPGKDAELGYTWNYYWR